MILNQNVPCRASAAWWLPFAGLAMGLFATPTLAQRTPQEPVEVRVNGKAVEDLSAAERKALLRQLLAAEEDGVAEKATRKLTKKSAPAKSKTAKAGHGEGHGAGHGEGHGAGHGEGHGVGHGEGHSVGHGEGHGDAAPAARKKQLRIARSRDAGDDAPESKGSGVRAEIMKGLAEARAEIAADEDLRELGITDEVMALIDNIGNGEGLEGSLDIVVRAAMGGIGKKIRDEIAEDDDLRELGLDQGIMKLVTDFLGNERNQEMISDFVMSAAGKAMQEAKAEIRADVDLERLGLTAEVEGLLDSLMKGGAPLDRQLQKLLDKSLRAAGREMDEAMRSVEVDDDRETKAKPRKKGLRIKIGDGAVVR